MPTRKVVLDDGTEIPFEVAEGARVEDVRAAAQSALNDFVRTRQPAQQEAAAQEQAAPDIAAPETTEVVEQEDPLDAADVAVGAADITGSLVSGGFGSIVGGLAGLAGLAVGTFTEDGASATANRWLDATSDALTWDPKSRAGKELLETVAPVLVEAQATMRDGVEFVSGGNVLMSTALETAILGFVEILGAKGIARSVNPANVARKTRAATARALDQMGINPKNKTIRQDIVRAAKEVAPEARGQHIEAVETALIASRTAERNRVSALYNQARQGNVFFDVDKAKDIASSVRQSLIDDGFEMTTPEMERVLSNLDRLDNIGTVRPSTGEVLKTPVLATKFNELEIVRRTFGNQGAELAGGARAAAFRAKNAIDDAVASSLSDINLEAGGRIKFGQGAISGDANAIQWWSDARAASARFKDIYTDEKAIANMIRKDMTAQEVSQSILGASALGSRKDAARIIRKIKDGTGNDSNVMDALRAETMYNIMEPMTLNNESGIARFVNNYKSVMARNPDLMRELDLDRGPIKLLADTAEVAAGLPQPGRAGAVLDLVPRFFASRFGHQIAKKGFQQNMLKKFFQAIMGGNRVPKNKIIQEISGIDPTTPLFSNKPQFVAEIAFTQLPTSLQTILEDAGEPQ